MTSPNDVAALVERLRLEAKSGTGAALDWTDEERGDYWSRVALRLRPLCREAASVLASVLRERDEAHETVEPIGYLWKTIDDRWAFTERNAPNGSGRPVVFASALEASEAKVATQAATIAALQAEVERAKEELRKLKRPEFFWDYDNPEGNYNDWSDPLEEVDMGDVVHLLTGVSLPPVWVTTRVLTVDEDGDPDETEPALFHNEAEAVACYPASLEAARSASRKENTP